jgi:hypothetical protein
LLARRVCIPPASGPDEDLHRSGLEADLTADRSGCDPPQAGFLDLFDVLTLWT